MPSFPSAPLSVLDQSIAAAGRAQGQSIRDTVALARHCEKLGYRRFWVSEHHNHPTIVGTAPEILLGAIAAVTARIRIGAAGIMLPHYAPFKVAEQFRVLDALAPGRVDLGLGRAPGSDGRTAFALNPRANERPNEFPADVLDLMAWVSGNPLPDGHPFASLKANPMGDTAPEVWMLGSSDYGAQVAAHFGLPYCFAWFFSDGQGAERAMELYRKLYKPSALNPRPHAALCVWALACDTAAEARHHFLPRAKWRVLRDRGVYTALESPEEAARAEFTDEEQARMARMTDRAFIGTAAETGAKIRALAEELQADEIAVVAWTHDEEVRRRSYELLAKEFGMTV